MRMWYAKHSTQKCMHTNWISSKHLRASTHFCAVLLGAVRICAVQFECMQIFTVCHNVTHLYSYLHHTARKYAWMKTIQILPARRRKVCLNKRSVWTRFWRVCVCGVWNTTPKNAHMKTGSSANISELLHCFAQQCTVQLGAVCVCAWQSSSSGSGFNFWITTKQLYANLFSFPPVN